MTHRLSWSLLAAALFFAVRGTSPPGEGSVDDDEDDGEPDHHDGPRVIPENSDFRGFLKEMDTDGDRKLSLQEMIDHITGIDSVDKNDPDVIQMQKEEIERMKVDFQKSDADGDGKLTYHEAVIMLQHSGGLDVVDQALEGEQEEL
eukprot:TRINITY_DN114463_c0_g1_i1.p1 TRINITY_DN114463_c0_g1~~TRINITY_DN114463_c0_g1_i1.p1  ORF type:complete len:146 (-),score=47.06 TRINITY_DN114463_c0_g1_i1:32-469(-)